MTVPPTTPPNPQGPHLAALLPWAIAMLVAALLFVLFQPGYFSFDSAHQWWMARSGQLDTTHPALMVRVWQASRLLLPDPEGFFALQLALLWGGLAFVVTALPFRTTFRIGTLLGIGLWPSFLALQPQLWKDLWMVAALLWAVGALLREQASPAWRWRLVALLALATATAFRFNALTAVLPLWAWCAWRIARVPVAGASTTRARSVVPARLLAMLSLPVLLGLAALPDRLGGVRPVTVWPIMALWDLAAVSIETGTMHVPPVFLKPGATVDDLARDFRPHVNVPSFTTGTIRFHYELEVPAEDLAALRKDWLALAWREPRAFLDHRLRLSAFLFGLRNKELPDGSVLMPTLVPFLDNPPLAMAPSPLRDRLVALWHRAIDGPFFMGWIYLFVVLVTLAAGLRRRQIAAVAVAASALGIALPLVPLATAADFRYLLWLVVGSLLAAVLCVGRAGPRRTSA